MKIFLNNLEPGLSVILIHLALDDEEMKLLREIIRIMEANGGRTISVSLQAKKHEN
jgi:hypothetical protein